MDRPGADARSVLIVDDEPAAVWTLGRILVQAGFEVSTCLGAEEAINLLGEQSFGWVITDISMPLVSGLGVVDWVRAHCPETRVIVITGLGTRALRDIALRRGVYLYLEKPIDPDLLTSAMADPGSNTGFVGVMDDVNLLDYLQMIKAIRRRGIIRIVGRTGESAAVFLDGGTVRHAECGDATGREAFFRCLDLEAGSLSVQPWTDPPVESINVSADALLLEAARRQDEAARDLVTGAVQEAGVP
ncbi:MAG: response regulator [Armatimonadetes bacterium]|nr:response regulator [Armatimonadota bacterium]